MNIMVSVICLTYNHEKYIADCLESLVNQETNFKYEILVHDDASIDKTKDIIEKYRVLYPHLIYPIYESENLYSQGKSIQEPLIKVSKGKYLAFCEGDDYWNDKTKLQKQFEALEKNTDCSMCVHKVLIVNKEGRSTDKIHGSKFKYGILQGDYFIKNYLMDKKGFYFQTSSYFIKKDVIVNMPEELNRFGVGDIPMLLQSSLCGNIFFIDEILSSYRSFTEGSTNVMMLNKDYALNRINKSISGFLGFNSISRGKYWLYMKHRVLYYIAQSFFSGKNNLYGFTLKDLIYELSVYELAVAIIKFSKLGNWLINFKAKSSVFQ